MVESLVFFSFVATLLILLIKSRIFKVGVDQAEQFEPENLARMINNIFDHIDLDLFQKERRRMETKALWVNKRRSVTVDNVKIYLKLTDEGYETVIKNMIMGKLYLIPPIEASMWFKKNVFGKVKRRDLDDARFLEIGSTDMIYNIPMVYHNESISEMQLMCLAASYIMEKKLGPSDWNSIENFGLVLFWLLVAENSYNWVTEMYRHWEIDYRGRPNIHGIKRAKVETVLRSV